MSAQAATNGDRPRLVFFYSQHSGRSRRVEGYLSQVLQRRRNHDAFQIYRVEVGDQPELAQRFRIAEVPTLVVVEGSKVSSRLVVPRGCREIEHMLGPWLR
jgi:thioredoxin-like negative regulator of GroEL